MLFLSKKDIDTVFSMKDAIEANKVAFKLFSSNKCDVPLRVRVENKKEDAVSLFMPGYIEEIGSLGQKIVSVYPNNSSKNLPVVGATVILLDTQTGMVNSMIDGTYLTQVRTGAAAGAATDLLARKDAKIGALFGTGGQALKQLEAMINARDLEEVRVYGRNKEKTISFVEKVKSELNNYNVNIIAASSKEEVLCDADVITLITTATESIIDYKLIKKGAHINGVGAYTPLMQEIDEDTIINADKIYVDSIEACMAEAGDILKPLNKNLITIEKITGEIGKVVTNEIVGRETDEEITIFKSVGIAAQDLVSATNIYNKAIKFNVGTKIDF